MTLREIENDALEALGFDSSSTASAVVRVRVRRQINWAHRQLLATPGLLRLLRDSMQAFTFMSAAGVGRYGLPASLGRINSIYEAVNRLRLGQIQLDAIREADPALAEVGPPSGYALLGLYQVRTQPKAAIPLISLVSTAVGDTTQSASLDYISASGDRLSSQALLTGTVEAAFGALATNEITKFHLSAPAAGVVTLYNGSSVGGTVLAVIPPGRTHQTYQHVQLWPTPAGAMPYAVDYTHEMADLSEPLDAPFLPADFHELLSVGAQLREYRKADDARALALQQEWDAGIVRLKWWVMNPAQQQSELLGPVSQLGGWYAAGT